MRKRREEEEGEEKEGGGVKARGVGTEEHKGERERGVVKGGWSVREQGVV